MVYGAIAQIARPILTKFGRYVYTGLRQQDKIVDWAYKSTGLYNRGVVQGIKHGLIAGQIIGGTLQLGLNAPDTPGNDVVQTPNRNGNKTGPSYKTRRRQTTRFGTKCPSRRRPYSKYRRSRSR